MPGRGRFDGVDDLTAARIRVWIGYDELAAVSLERALKRRDLRASLRRLERHGMERHEKKGLLRPQAEPRGQGVARFARMPVHAIEPRRAEVEDAPWLLAHL